jgi:hypothetical protein
MKNVLYLILFCLSMASVVSNSCEAGRKSKDLEGREDREDKEKQFLKNFELKDGVVVDGDLDRINQLLQRHKMEFNHYFKVNNANYTFSDLFLLDQNGRMAVLFQVKIESGSYLRCAYQSNSQGVFRVMPAMNIGMVPSYDKGLGETSLDLPYRLQKMLSGMKLTRGDISQSEGNELCKAAVHANNTREEWRSYQETLKQEFRVFSVLKEASNVGEFSEEGFRPDFSNEKDNYSFHSPVTGETGAFVYLSFNERLSYIVHQSSGTEEQYARIWVASIGDTLSEISKYGVYRDAANPGKLATPLWEYEMHIPVGLRKGHHHPEYPFYLLNWAEVKSLPIIGEWFRVKEIQMPPTQDPLPPTQPTQEMY